MDSYVVLLIFYNMLKGTVIIVDLFQLEIETDLRQQAAGDYFSVYCHLTLRAVGVF